MPLLKNKLVCSYIKICAAISEFVFAVHGDYIYLPFLCSWLTEIIFGLSE
jgi:hypothetical protein